MLHVRGAHSGGHPEGNPRQEGHTKGEAVILSDQEIDAAQLHAAIDPTGYTIGELRSEPYEKKGFTLFGKR